MATYYVSKAGNDSNNGTSEGTSKLTISQACLTASADGDIVEIIDEGSYNEAGMRIENHNITVRHTASLLGRPSINGGGNPGGLAHGFFVNGAFSGTTFHGLEMSNYAEYPIKNNGSYRAYNLTGCFLHSNVKVAAYGIKNSTDAEPATIYESILFIETKFAVESKTHIRNCFITGSFQDLLITNWGDTDPILTASYCTLINRHPDWADGNPDPTIQANNVTNCIVSGAASTGANPGDGIASGDHTYNLVVVGGTPFRNLADNGDGTAGTGDITGSDPLFVDGTAIGYSPDIAANYELQEESPAVGYANPIGILFDLTGNARPEGGDPGSEDNPDIGCFEYQFAPPAPAPSTPTASTAWSSYGTQSSPNFDSGFTINLYQNLTSNYRLPSGECTTVPFTLSSSGEEYNISISGNWSGTYSGSELSGSGSYNVSGSASGSSEFVLSSSGDHSGSYSGSISYGTGSYCISGSGVINLISGSDQFTGSYVSGSSSTISGTSGYNLTGTYASYYFCGYGAYYVSGSSIHTLSGSGTGSGPLATASYYISGANSYNITGASEYYISGKHQEASFSGTGSMTLTGTGSYNFVGEQCTYASSPGQVPFSLGAKGPGTLRGRLGAYGVSKGGDPSILIQTSSA